MKQEISMKNKQLISACRISLLVILLCVSTLATGQQIQSDTVRVLSIGNSFSRDAFSYVPFIMEELAPDVVVDWGIMYIGGCSLEQHWKNWMQESPAYEFDRFCTGDSHWRVEYDVNLQHALAAGEWDVVILQQKSNFSYMYDTYQPYLNRLLEEIKKECTHITFAWLLTQAYGEGFHELKGMSSNEMWNKVAEAAQRVVNETDVQLLIPAGTAIQNARHTSLDRLGAAGHMVYDGFHLHEGIAPLMEGLCAVSVVLHHYGIEVDVEQSDLRITPLWRQKRRTPQPHGDPEVVTDEEYTIARRCARWALESPLQLTVEE